MMENGRLFAVLKKNGQLFALYLYLRQIRTKNTAISELELPNSHFTLLTVFNIVNRNLQKAVYFRTYIQFTTRLQKPIDISRANVQTISIHSFYYFIPLQQRPAILHSRRRTKIITFILYLYRGGQSHTVYFFDGYLI